MSGWSLSTFSPLLAAAALSLAAPPGAARADDPGVAIRVRVPAGAEIWFDGAKTTVTGTSRLFHTPPLDPGRVYSYEVRVRWADGDGTVEQTRRLTFRVGDRVDLDFTSPNAGVVPTAFSISVPERPSPTRQTAPGTIRTDFPVEAAPPRLRSLSEQSPLRDAGPPGSNNPMSAGGVGQG
jgi:uncharacterized protein (TIGR03000 family)